MEFATLTKQWPQLKKTFAWANHGSLQKLLEKELRLGGEKVRVEKAARTLGAWINYTGQHFAGLQHQRVEKAIGTGERVFWLPASPSERRSIFGTASIPQGAYG